MRTWNEEAGNAGTEQLTKGDLGESVAYKFSGLLYYFFAALPQTVQITLIDTVIVV